MTRGDAMVVIAYRTRFPAGWSGPWVLMGKNVALRNRVTATLGATQQIRLGNRLHHVAQQLRQSYLDCIGAMGMHCHDRVTWWSTGLSWKSWGISDGFLLVCYLRLISELAEAARSKAESLLILVEDPWLFCQLQSSPMACGSAQIQGRVCLWPHKIRSLGLGLLKRGWWCGRTGAHYVKQRWTWGVRSLAAPQAPTVGLYTHPSARSLTSDGRWHDPFLPQVEERLANLGHHITRFTPPEAAGFEREIARRHQQFHPLILYATLAGAWRALSAWWPPYGIAPCMVDGMDIHHLIAREWWQEIERSSLCIYRMFYECLRRMLSRGAWCWLVYPYENQPWEKMIALCAKERGIRTMGIQHAIFSSMSLSYFCGQSEAHQMPLPDIIGTSGTYPRRLLREGGVDVERLCLIGSVRYDHPRVQLKAAPTTDILVALPIDRSLVSHMLAALRDAFPSGGQGDGLRFYIRPHPMCPVRRIDFPAELANGDLSQYLEQCGLIIFSGSTIGPEAAMLGRKVIRFRSEYLLDIDPAEIYGDLISTCSAITIRDVVLGEVRNGSLMSHAVRLQDLSRQLFQSVDPKAFHAVFGKIAEAI